MLRHRHTLGEGCQQADYPLIEPVEMSELKCSLFPTTYLLSVCPLRQGISKKYRYRLEISLEICVHFVSTKK